MNELSSQQLLSNSEKFSLQLANHTISTGMTKRDIIEDNISTYVSLSNALYDSVFDVLSYINPSPNG